MTFNQKGKNIVKNKKCLKIRKFSNENENDISEIISYNEEI
jgi:hypothetical protein